MPTTHPTKTFLRFDQLQMIDIHRLPIYSTDPTLDEQNKSDLTLKEISLLHTEIKQYTDDIIHSIWDENNKRETGSYAYFAPGEREKYQPFLGQSYPINNPRIFFAGEHLAINHASIQGAIQTAISLLFWYF